MQCAALSEKLPGLPDRLLELRQGGIGQTREIAGLVEQEHGLVLQALDAVVDLLQGARGREQILAVIAGIEDGHLRARRHTGGEPGRKRDSGEQHANATSGHRKSPPGW
jgi:hypothetical protein